MSNAVRIYNENAGHTHEAAIEAVYDAGYTAGCLAVRFPVTVPIEQLFEEEETGPVQEVNPDQATLDLEPEIVEPAVVEEPTPEPMPEPTPPIEIPEPIAAPSTTS